MNKVYFSKLMLLSMIAFFAMNTKTTQAAEPDSIMMGPAYANDVYYSFQNQVVAEVPRAGWDIAFHTNRWSATVITNDGVGVTLFAYPKSDSAGWASVDTTGISTWKPLFNNHQDWEDGACNRYAAGHPDYGWGVYNMISHDVVGDSIFIIKAEGGIFKKFRIINKNSINNLYTFRYANLDGSDDQTIQLDCDDYITKNFVAYSIVTSAVIDREPTSDSWDILFTKYMTIHPSGAPYNVSGVLSNIGVTVAKAYPVAPNHTDWGLLEFTGDRSAIGWDWKTFDMNTFTYILSDSTFFYVKDLAGNVNRLEFTKFIGSSSGKIVFNKGVSSASSVAETNPENLMIWPNPATDIIHINAESSIQQLNVYTISGARIITNSLSSGNSSQININSLKPGMYILETKTVQSTQRLRFIKK